MNDPAAGQGQIGLDGVQFPVSYRQRAGIASEDGTFVQQPGPLDSLVRAHRRLRLP
jgi:hypothetical protein